MRNLAGRLGLVSAEFFFSVWSVVQTPDRSLEPSAADMRRLVEGALARVIQHIESLPSQPACDVEGGVELARSLRESGPENAVAYAELLRLIFDPPAPKSFNTAGPGYPAHLPRRGA